MFDVGRSFFILVHSSVFNRICCIQIYAGSGALNLFKVKDFAMQSGNLPKNRIAELYLDFKSWLTY